MKTGIAAIFFCFLALAGYLYHSHQNLLRLEYANATLATHNEDLLERIAVMRSGMDSMSIRLSSLQPISRDSIYSHLYNSVYKIYAGTVTQVAEVYVEWEDDRDDEAMSAEEGQNIEWSAGTAFCIYHPDMLLTNAHVVSRYSDFLIVEDHTGHIYPVKHIIAYDSLLDYALLYVPGLEGRPLEISEQAPEMHQPVITMGNPLGLDYTLSEGRITGLRLDGLVLQINVPVTYGNSGGPLISEDGRISGLVFGGMGDAAMLNLRSIFITFMRIFWIRSMRTNLNIRQKCRSVTGNQYLRCLVFAK
ncbi:MAG: trypsin-like peptidase domain-containing protein [Saprospiraceae bacterium]|nr:trypsin-like peptidase domain-containing protein [Saprospiraceae bacterium]